jgi:hypothetical protein
MTTRPTLRSVLDRNPDTAFKLFSYSLALFGFSLGTFFFLSSEAIGSILVSPNKATRDVVAAVGGILVANIIIAVYVIDAFNEKPDPKESKKE